MERPTLDRSQLLDLAPHRPGAVQAAAAPADTPECRESWADAFRRTGTNLAVHDAMWRSILSLPARVAAGPDGPEPTFFHIANAQASLWPRGINAFLSLVSHGEGWGVGYCVFPDGEGGRPLSVPHRLALQPVFGKLILLLGPAERPPPTLEEIGADPALRARVFGDDLVQPPHLH